MTYYSKPEARPEIGTFLGFDHAKFYVSNAKQAASFYTTRMGFTPCAYQGLETGNRDYCTQVVKTGKIILAFMSPLNPTEQEVNSHIMKHGDGVQDIAFTVDNARAIYDTAVSRGAVSFKEPEELRDEFGSVIIASVRTYGDIVHTFVQRVDYTGPFLPGFKAIAVDDPINACFPPTNLEFIDHIVGNQLANTMLEVTNWYENILDFHRFWSADDKQVHTQYSSLRSIVVADWDEVIKMPINEPAEGKKMSQTQEFCEFYGGPGAQHIALHTSDLLETVAQLRARGLTFLPIPLAYYENLEKRLASSPITIHEDLNRIKELNIVVDFDDKGYLLQIFSMPVEDRPTLFFEFMQRHNNNGFGVGNFRSLFQAMEDEQARRGNLY